MPFFWQTPILPARGALLPVANNAGFQGPPVLRTMPGLPGLLVVQVVLDSHGPSGLWVSAPAVSSLRYYFRSRSSR